MNQKKRLRNERSCIYIGNALNDELDDEENDMRWQRSKQCSRVCL